MASADTLLGGPGAFGVRLKQFRAMVGFDDDHIAVSDILAHMLRSMTEIRKPGHRPTWGKEISLMPMGKTETDWILGVMRDGERIDFQILEAKTRTGFENLPGWPVFEPGLYGASRGGIGEHLDMRVFSKPIDGGRVVPMFVRQEYGVDSLQ